MKQKIYLSGPMTGYPDYNRPAFLKAESELQTVLDASFINPARITPPKAGQLWHDYMRSSLKGMLDAEVIYMLNGWENSKGAKIELALAKELGMRVMYQPMPALDYISMLETGFLILDTETTGLGDDAEIVEIAVIDESGEVLINTLVNPSKPVLADAVKIHGISNEMLAGMPDWNEVSRVVQFTINSDRPLIIWNKAFDIRLMTQSDKINQPASHVWTLPPARHELVRCAQQDYMRRYGQRKPDGTLKRQSLAAACEHLGIKQDKTKAHRALYDCQMTLEVIKALAAKDQERML